MAEDQQKKKLKEPFRLILVKEDTLEEVASYRLSLLNIYMLLSSVIVIVAIVIVAIIFFTPIKRLVPGYADITENREYVELYKKFDALKARVEAQELYNRTFRNLITGGDSALLADLDERMEDQELPPFQESRFAANIEATSNADTQRVRSFSGTETSNLSNTREIDYIYIIPPVKGPVSAPYDAAEEHFGVDVLAPKNTAVKAVLDGYIITSDWTLETGNTLGIQHDNDMVSFYKHNARNLKKLGSFVRAGEAVAIIGNTGEQSSGPHLHFELWVDGKPVDPQNFIEF